MEKNKKTILVVDDEEVLRSLYKDTFEAKGYNVLTAENGYEMFKQLESHPEVDIISLDVVMPEMDGFDALQKLRNDERYRLMNVVMCTNLGEEDCQESLELGANYCFRKAIGTPAELVKVIESYLKKK